MADTGTQLLETTDYDRPMVEWSFLTNHGQALLCIANDPGVRLRDIAETLRITERSAYSIVSDLSQAGYVVKEKDGRRNRYIVQRHLPLPETTIRERTVGDVLKVLGGTNHSRSGRVGPKNASKTAKKTRSVQNAKKPR